MAGLWQDLRYSLRSLRTHPLFTLAAVLTLTLGVGANSTIYSLIHGILLRPLPYPEPERLVAVSENVLTEPAAPEPVSVPNFFDWRRQSRSFEELAAWYRWNASLTGGGEPERLWVGFVSSGFFPVLRGKPAMGRAFLPGEDAPGANPVAVLSHGLWRRRFGGSERALGSKVMLDGKPHTVVGVMPRGFDFPKGAELWAPLGYSPDAEPRNFGFLNGVGRLRPGVRVEAAAAEMSALAGRLARQYPDSNAGRGALVVPLHERLVGKIRPALLVLLAAVLLVLLLAIVNLINLFLVRQGARGHETTVRAALGAGRMQLIRQPLVEGLLLALLGAGGGLLLAAGAVRLLARLGPAQIPRLEEVGLEARVLVLTLAVALAAGLAGALTSALRSSRPQLVEQLNASGRGLEGGVAGARARRGLAVVEIALALPLLIGAGLLVKSLSGLQEVDPGFAPAGTVTMQVELPEPDYPEDHQPAGFYTRLYPRIAALPGVEKVGGIFLLPLSGMNATTRFTIEGEAPSQAEEKKVASMRPVSPGYFAAMKIPVLQGRSFDTGDDASGPPVAIVNEALARRFWPGQSPLGRRVVFDANFGSTGRVDAAPREIVGVVGDVRESGLDKEASPALYFPHLQSSWRMMSLAVRTSGDPLALVPAVRREIWALDRNLPVSEVKTLEQMLADSLARPRFSTLLVSSFAGLALLLAAVGIYGVLSFSVSRRTHEIGVRVALGADPGDILRLVLREALLVAGLGIALGLAASLALTRLLESQLVGVEPRDPAVFGAATVALLLTALAAGALPARRAARLDPARVLKDEGTPPRGGSLPLSIYHY